MLCFRVSGADVVSKLITESKISPKVKEEDDDESATKFDDKIGTEAPQAEETSDRKSVKRQVEDVEESSPSEKLDGNISLM